MSRTNVRFVTLLAAMIGATLAAAWGANDVAIALAIGAAALTVLEAVASWRGCHDGDLPGDHRRGARLGRLADAPRPWGYAVGGDDVRLLSRRDDRPFGRLSGRGFLMPSAGA